MSITTVGQIDVKINTGEITKAVEELNKLAKVASTTQTSIDGLSKVSLSNLISQLGVVNRSFGDINKSASGAAGSVSKMANVSLGALGQQITIINNSFSQTNTTVNQFNQTLNQTTAAAGKVGAALRSMTQVQKLNAARDILDIRGFAEIQREIQRVEAAYNRLAASGKLSAAELAVANQAKITSIKKLRDEMEGASSSVSKFAQIGGLVLLGQQIISVGKYFYDAYQTVQSLTLGISALGQVGGVEIANMRANASNLGIVFSDVAKAQLQWRASIADTVLEGQKGDAVFNNIAGAIRLFGGGTEEVSGSLRALTQMMSKGTIQSEELKGQLGERLPGAFKMMADALGLSTRELNDALKNGAVESGFAIEKLAKTIEDRYGNAIDGAANTTQGAINRMRNDWTAFSAGVGRDIDTFVGKIAKLINEWGILRGLAAMSEKSGIVAGIAGAAKLDGTTPDGKAITTPEAKANRMMQDANALLERKGFAPIAPKVSVVERENPGYGQSRSTSRLETTAEAIARTLSTLNGEISTRRAAPGFNANNPDFKKLVEQQRIISDAINNNGDSKGQAAARARAGASEARDAKQFEENRDFDTRQADALRTNNQRELIKLEIERKTKALEDTPTASPKAWAERNSAIRTQIAGLEGRLAQLDKKEAKAGATAANAAETARDRDLQRASNITGQGSTDYARLRERMLTLTDPDGIEGAIAREQRLFAQRRTAIKELKNLTDAEKTARIAQLDLDEEGVIAQIRANDAIENQIKERKKIETDISRIIDDRRAKETRANLDIAKYSTQLAAINNLPVNGGKPFFEQLDTRSKYAKGRDAAKEKAENGYDGIEKSIRDNITKSGEELKQLRARLAETKDTAEKAGTIAARQPEIDEIERSIAAAKQEVEDLSKQLDRVTKDKSNAGVLAVKQYNADRNDARRLDKGIEKGAVNYLDTIKDKSERAADVTMQFGKSLEGVLMSNSWAEARNNAKGFFAGLLNSIRESIVQLLIVKPIIKSIMDMSSKNFDSGGGDFFGKLVNGVLGIFGINSGLPSGAGASSISTMSSGTPSIGAFAANGGVFAGGVKYFANGGVFDRATAFPMANNQVGIAGESGPEAILGLKRDARGKLGVMASGAGGSQVINHVQITVQGNADSDTIAEMEDRLTRRMAEISKAQTSAAIQKANRPGGANYGR